MFSWVRREARISSADGLSNREGEVMVMGEGERWWLIGGHWVPGRALRGDPEVCGVAQDVGWRSVAPRMRPSRTGRLSDGEGCACGEIHLRGVAGIGGKGTREARPEP